MTIEIIWLGHSGFALTIDDHRVLIDPFLSGNPVAPFGVDAVDADYILLSHGHGDHVKDTPGIARRTGATVVANVEVAGWMHNKQGVEKTIGINTGGGVKLPFGRVELTIAHHSSSMPDGAYGGMPNGILIFTNGGKTIYHAGDTTVFAEMQWIGELGIDLAMLPIGDYYTMGPPGSLRAVGLLRPKVVMPMHYNTFDVIAQDAAAWARRVTAETGAKPVVLEPGGTYSL
jgi:L-ascorbate metabolism protein UlaG (beta-lactamase superfamily)